MKDHYLQICSTYLLAGALKEKRDCNQFGHPKTEPLFAYIKFAKIFVLVNTSRKVLSVMILVYSVENLCGDDFWIYGRNSNQISHGKCIFHVKVQV